MLNNIGLPGLLLIAVVVLVLFGRGKISSLMGEVGKGITSFKKGVAEGSKETDDEQDPEVRSVENQTATPRDVTPTPVATSAATDATTTTGTTTGTTPTGKPVATPSKTGGSDKV